MPGKGAGKGQAARGAPSAAGGRAAAQSKARPTVRVGDIVRAPWGFGRRDFDVTDQHEGRVSAVHSDGSLEVSFIGPFEGWVEPRVPRGLYSWAISASALARFDAAVARGTARGAPRPAGAAGTGGS